MCTVYAQCFCNILGFLKIKFIVGKMYGIMFTNYVTNTAKNIKNNVENT